MYIMLNYDLRYTSTSNLCHCWLFRVYLSMLVMICLCVTLWCVAVPRDGAGGDPVLLVPAQLLHSGQSECLMLTVLIFLLTVCFLSLTVCFLCLRITRWRAWATRCSPSCSTWGSSDWCSRGRWGSIHYHCVRPPQVTSHLTHPHEEAVST